MSEIENRFSRQADLIKCDLSTPITVIGAGGIGSFLVLTLAKMGFTHITVYDDDSVEEHNLPNQFYREEDIGKPKVVALMDLVYAFTGTRIQGCSIRFEANDEEFTPTPVLISAVDNMSTRRALFDEFITNEHIKVFMDGRMGANQIEVYTVTNDGEAYEKTLWTDAEASIVPCTSKATMFTVLAIASFMASNLRMVLAGQEVKPKMIMDMFNMKLY